MNLHDMLRQLALSNHVHLMVSIVFLVTVIVSLVTATAATGNPLRAFERTSSIANDSIFLYLAYLQLILTMTGPLFYGSLTRKLFSIWRQAVGKGQAAAEDVRLAGAGSWNSSHNLSIADIQLLFHQVEVYPTESQIYEMIQCASRCSRHSGGNVGHDGPICPKIDPNSNFLSFGEFCFFAGVLMTHYRQGSSPMLPTINAKLRREREDFFEDYANDDEGGCDFDVFLGGSCNPTSWRSGIVIPELKRNAITYYNPQVDHWGPELIELEDHAKENSEILFFVIDNQTRAIASMIEVAFICSTDRKLVLVINQLEPESTVSGEPILKEEYECLLKARTYLSDLVQRADIPVFTQIDLAIRSTVRMIKTGLRPQELSHQIDQVMPVRMGHISVADKMINISKVYETLKNASNEFTFSELKLAYRSLTRKELPDDMIVEMAERHLMERHADEGDDEVGGHQQQLASDDDVPSKVGCPLPPLDRITIDFDQFCAIMTELNEEQLKKSVQQHQRHHGQQQQQPQTKSETIDRRSMLLVWLYFLKSLPIVFLKCLNRYFNVLLKLTISNGADKAQQQQRRQQQPPQPPPDRMSGSLFDINEQESNEMKVVVGNGAAAPPPPPGHRQPPPPPPPPPTTGFEANAFAARKASQANLPVHMKYVPSHHTTPRYSIHFANNNNNNHNPCDAIIKADRIRRHSVSQSRFSPSPPPPLTTSRHYQPYQGASRHHLHHHHHHHQHQHHHHHAIHTTDSSSSISSLMYNSKYTNLFIGGEVELSLLEATIIPELKKHSITYSTPMLHRWTTQRMIPLQAKNIEKNRVLLFIITKDSLDIASMILSAYYVGLGYKVVLCIQNIDSTSHIWNKLSATAIKDYNRGRAYLSDMATKAGVPVFSDIMEALHRAIEVCDE